jgi:uncharacterized membrane protein
MKRLVNSFVRGLLVVGPVALTLYVCYVVFSVIDGIVRIGIPGAGFVLTVALITLIGFLATTFLTRRLVGAMEHLLNRLPLVRLLYASVKDLLNAFVGERRRFDKPVMVTLADGADTGVLGFLTQDGLDQLGLPGYAAVYVPQSYNFAGNLLVTPRNRVKPLTLDSASVMAFIISGGVTEARAG